MKKPTTQWGLQALYSGAWLSVPGGIIEATRRGDTVLLSDPILGLTPIGWTPVRLLVREPIRLRPYGTAA